ncbi:MAG TPA: hypothetical protein V6D33_11675 [Cyanophyceae cyanobacterium]
MLTAPCIKARSPHYRRKNSDRVPDSISPQALAEMASRLEQSFASLWVERYPDLHLYTQVPFAFSPRGKVRASKLRADFAFGHNIEYAKGKPFLLLPPGVLIEVDGGVHRYKWDNDVQKEAVARELGFKFYRVYEATMHLMVDAIAADILELQKFSSK